jgi:hypothetical protein
VSRKGRELEDFLLIDEKHCGISVLGEEMKQPISESVYLLGHFLQPGAHVLYKHRMVLVFKECLYKT